MTRRYRYDWQYAVDKARLPLIAQASATIAAMPVLVNAGLFGNIFRSSVNPALWLAWASAILFLLAYAAVNIRCPRFVQEYRDYGEYTEREHSHRWVIWEFYNNVERLTGWHALIAECELKGIAEPLGSLNADEQTAISPSFTSNNDAGVRLKKPINHKRNIYLPVERGAERIVIYLREDDDAMDKKVKEAFWILFSQAVKERPISKFIFWSLWYLFVVTGVSAIAWNAWSAING